MEATPTKTWRFLVGGIWAGEIFSLTSHMLCRLERVPRAFPSPYILLEIPPSSSQSPVSSLLEFGLRFDATQGACYNIVVAVMATGQKSRLKGTYKPGRVLLHCDGRKAGSYIV
jgi:hypothetical protein